MPKKITTKDAWVETGFLSFSTGGTEALKIESMARTLGVSKASFYHFFENRNTYILDIITYWSDLRTKEFIELSELENTPEEKIKTLMLTIFSAEIEDDFVFHLRRLGTINQEAGDLLRSVEVRRIGFTSSLIKELGFTSDEANKKAVIIYNYYLGWRERQRSVLNKDTNPKDQLELLIDQLCLLPT